MDSFVVFITILLWGVFNKNGSVLCMLAYVKIFWNNIVIVSSMVGLIGGITDMCLDKFGLYGIVAKLTLEVLLQVYLWEISMDLSVENFTWGIYY